MYKPIEMEYIPLKVVVAREKYKDMVKDSLLGAVLLVIFIALAGVILYAI